MLDFLRKHTAGLVAKVLFTLLIVSFGIWGVGDMIRVHSASDAVATVGGANISGQDFDVEFTRAMNRLRQRLGPSIDRQQARAFGLDSQVLKNMVTRTLFSEGAAKLGVVAPDANVIATVHQIPAFKDKQGTFDRIRFDEVLRASEMNENEYLGMVRGDLVREQYLQSLNAEVPVPNTLADTLYAYTHEKRAAETLRVADAAVPAPPAPTEAQLKTYHEAHKAEFTAPEYRAVTALVLRASDLAKTIKISDADLKSAYDDRQGDFKLPERRVLRQMVLPTEDAAKKAEAMIAGGKSFVDVAKTVAKMDPKALEIGAVRRDKMLPALAKVAFSTPVGAVSKPVKSPLGWHLIQVEKILPPTVETLDQVRDKLSASIAKDRAVDVLYKEVNKTEDRLGGGATIEEAAKAEHVKPLKIAAIDKNGNAPDGKPVTDIPKASSFLNTVFSTDEGAASLMIEGTNDTYFVVRVDKVTPPTLKPLADVRAAVVAGWTADARKDAADKLAKDLLAKAKSGTSLADLAKTAGAKVETTLPFTRTSSDLPGSIVGDLFEGKVGAVAMARDGAGYVIARLTEIKKADPSADKKAVEALADKIKPTIQNDLLVELANGLRVDHPVAIHPAAIERIFGTKG